MALLCTGDTVCRSRALRHGHDVLHTARFAPKRTRVMRIENARYERRRRASLDGGSKIIFANGARDDAKRREAGATRRDGTKSARAGEVVDGAVGAGGDARSRADAGGAMIRRLGWAFEATAARGCPV